MRVLKLSLRFALLNLLIGAAVGGVVLAFAPRLLLLDETTVRGSLPLLVASVSIWVFLMTALSIVLVYRRRSVLRALESPEYGALVASEEIVAFNSLPTRLSLSGVLFGLALLAASLLTPLRPKTNDLYTQSALVVLVFTLLTVALLPYYVAARLQIARAIERLPLDLSRDALTYLARTRRLSHTPRRMLAALVMPVAFVSIGSMLLVHAHLRRAETELRNRTAREFALGVLASIGTSELGRAEAIETAIEQGYSAEIVPSSSRAPEDIRGDERTLLNLPIDATNTARVTFASVALEPFAPMYIGVFFVALSIAALLGRRIGTAYSDDVALATRELRMAGANDVIRGTRFFRDARFKSVAELMRAIDELGEAFREFAAAQERAIEVKSASERMRGLFLASMSHDLKAPLNSILGFAELASRAPLSDGQLENLMIIEQRGRELLYLIDTILDASRAEAGELVVTPEWTMVGDVVMSAVLDARELVVGAEVQIIGEIQPGVPRIWVEASRATQALTAVILIAARFAERGHIYVRATFPSAGERLRIDVEATGRGLPASERNKIFDAFKHTDRARKHGSLGLGPALARAIVTLHHGTITVDATEGTQIVFHVSFPTERMSHARH